MLEFNTIKQQLDKLFDDKDELTLHEAKYAWIVAFGYKPTKSQLMGKLGSVASIKRHHLYELIRNELTWVDRGKNQLLIFEENKIIA